MGIWNGGMHYTPWWQIAAVLLVGGSIGGIAVHRHAESAAACRAEIAYLANLARQSEQAQKLPNSDINMNAIRAGHECSSFSDEEVRRFAVDVGAAAATRRPK